MEYDFDICVVGSGAGGSPVAYEAANAGKKVVVLEKGPWFTEKDFSKDEISATRRSVYTPNLKDEYHILEDQKNDGTWKAKSTFDTGRDFWNGNCVGGSSNFMSGFFHRMKPKDFRLHSEYGKIKDANIVDWPITYDDLEKYYTKVEEVVGVSGQVVNHPNLEPRSTKDFPYPQLNEHFFSKKIDDACKKLGLYSLPIPRAIISKPKNNRGACYYSAYCGSYPCSSGAKSSARAALLNEAIKTGNLEIRDNSFVYKIETDAKGLARSVHYFNNGQQKKVSAKIFIIACQAIETSRLLLLSTGEKHPQGLGNKHNQVGKNLIFSAGGIGSGVINFNKFSKNDVEEIKNKGLFINRSLQDWYEINDNEFGKKAKGGTIDFLLQHPNAITRANKSKWGEDGLIWGVELKKKLEQEFLYQDKLKFEVFNDWLPTDNCFVSLDKEAKDKWGNPIAKIRLGYHPHDLKVADYLSKKAVQVFKELNLENVSYSVSGSPPNNLVAGGCRFGTDPKASVLDKDCRVHNCENLFVTDASFMPTGGSVPYTWTIYANSFRVADRILSEA